MAEIRTVTTLTTKREQLEAAIAHYEHALAQAQADLSHVNATIALFEPAPEALLPAPRYAQLKNLFRHREISTICRAALAEKGPMDTRELARHVMAVKGFHKDDAVLAKAIAYRIVAALRMQHMRGTVRDAGKRKGVRIWATI